MFWENDLNKLTHKARQEHHAGQNYLLPEKTLFEKIMIGVVLVIVVFGVAMTSIILDYFQIG